MTKNYKNGLHSSQLGPLSAILKQNKNNWKFDLSDLSDLSDFKKWGNFTMILFYDLAFYDLTFFTLFNVFLRYYKKSL